MGVGGYKRVWAREGGARAGARCSRIGQGGWVTTVVGLLRCYRIIIIIIMYYRDLYIARGCKVTLHVYKSVALVARLI